MAWTCSGQIINGQIECFKVETDFDKRFPEDKVFFSKDEQCVIVDGVLLNKEELLGSNSRNLEDYISSSLVDEDFPNKLRGPFTGLVFTGKSIFAFGNQTGDTCVFYYCNCDTFAISTDFNQIIKICRERKYPLTFDEVYANHILSFGFAVEGHTAIREITRTIPGCGIIVNNSGCHIEQYHVFKSNRKQISIDDAIEKLDVQFRKAVDRCFRKDEEYGYTHHLADMSGGLDSRMTSWVAHDLGYSSITNVSYSKSGSKESEYSELVANKLGNKFIFKALDDVHFVFDIYTLVKMNYGLAMYAGITGGKDLLSTIDFNSFGLEHTGQIGDVVIGSFAESQKDNESFNIKNMLYGDRIKPIINCSEEYKTKELFGLYYRAFQGALSTHQIRRHYTEAVSPFLDVDFIQFCLDLPIEYRCKHRLYFAWIEKKYPDALTIPSTRQKPGTGKLTKKDIYHKLPVPIRHLIIKICQTLHLVSVITDKNSMNPFDFWYENNAEMRQFINDFYDKHINAMSQYPDTFDQLKEVFEQGRTMDKLLVLTVLATYNIYLGEGGNT